MTWGSGQFINSEVIVGIFDFVKSSCSQPVLDRFVSLSIGNLLVLKACGFIEDQRAHILDVSESSLRVRIGHLWYERLRHGLKLKSSKPMEITLSINPMVKTAEEQVQRFTRPESSYCVIGVTIRPLSRSWKRSEFELESRRMLLKLRSHFMAC